MSEKSRLAGMVMGWPPPEAKPDSMDMDMVMGMHPPEAKQDKYRLVPSWLEETFESVASEKLKERFGLPWDEFWQHNIEDTVYPMYDTYNDLKEMGAFEGRPELESQFKKYAIASDILLAPSFPLTIPLRIKLGRMFKAAAKQGKDRSEQK